MKRLVEIISICLVLFSGCATNHTVEEYFGKVIDSDTKKPLEGAVILALYSTSRKSDTSYTHKLTDSALYSTLTPLAAQETITNKNGEFKIGKQQLNTQAWAQFVIFKPGYGNYPANQVVYVHYPEYHGPKGDYPSYILKNSGSLTPSKYLTIELPLLTSNPARALNIPAINFSVPYEKQRNLLSAISKELYLLNLPEYYSSHYFKKEFSH